MKKKTKKLIQRLTNYGVIIVGTFLMAVGYSVFLVPNNIAPGGFTGIALIFSQVTKLVFDADISNGTFYLLLNIPLFAISFKKIGAEFLISTALGMTTYSFFIDFVQYDLQIDDPLLCALYGGIIIGIGLGLVVRSNGSTGGTDILGVLVARKHPTFTIGKTIMVVDAAVVIINMFLNEPWIALYSLIAIFVHSIFCDYIVEGQRSVKAYYVISDKYEEISKNIIDKMNKGVTEIDVKGMYTRADRKMIFCLCYRRQVPELKRIVFSIDENAFVFSTAITDSIGEGFAKPEKPKPRKTYYRVKHNIEDENSNKDIV